jgi:hypothetical protein
LEEIAGLLKQIQTMLLPVRQHFQRLIGNASIFLRTAALAKAP